MPEVRSSDSKPIEIRKYPNRRYYDASRSRHLTLEEIRSLIREGCDVRVVDSQTSADITAKVLTQIILELDSPKLELFPAPLLTQLIRVNDQLVKGFIERFFNQALAAFLDYQKQFEAQLRAGSVFPSLFPPITAWTRAMFPPDNAGQTPAGGDSPKPAKEPEVPELLKRLEQQVADLQRQLAAKKGRRKRK